MTRGCVGAILVAFGLGEHSTTVLAFQEQPSIALSASRRLAARLDAVAPVAVLSFDSVDAAVGESIGVQITTAVENLSTWLVAPGGEQITQANIQVTYGGTFDVFGDLQSGFVQMYRFTSLGPGLYKVHLDAGVGFSGDTPVLAELQSDSPIRAQLFTVTESIPLGSPVAISTAIFEGATAVPGATVTATVRPPTVAQFSLSLLDDGVDATGDDAAGDGLYSAVLTPTEAGNYFVKAIITGTRSNGVPFVRESITRIEVIVPKATIPPTSVLSDSGIDLNANGLYDNLQIGIDFVAYTQVGNYIFHATLVTATGKKLSGYFKLVLPPTGSNDIGKGPRVCAEDIRAVGEDGPYTVTDISISFQDYYDPQEIVQVFRKTGLNYQTAAYTVGQFERPPIDLLSMDSDQRTGSGPNGLSEFLNVTLQVSVITPGDYDYQVSLADESCPGVIDTVRKKVPLTGALSETLEVFFDGAKIAGRGVDGPYVVSNFAMWGPAGGANRPPTFGRSTVGMTQAHNATDFEPGTPALDCNLTGLPDWCDITTEMSLDINDNGIPDECEPPRIASLSVFYTGRFLACNGGSNAGATCTLQVDCPGGYCWESMDTSKSFLALGSTASNNNVTNYWNGITGVRVFFNQTVAFATTPADAFTFEATPAGELGSTFSALTGAAANITVTSVDLPGGTGGTVVTIVLADDFVRRRWLKITLDSAQVTSSGDVLDGDLAGSPIALPSGDGIPGGNAVFILGNAAGDADGDRATLLTDVGVVRAVVNPFVSVPITDALNMDKDSKILLTDVGLVRADVNPFFVLPLISP